MISSGNIESMINADSNLVISDEADDSKGLTSLIYLLLIFG